MCNANTARHPVSHPCECDCNRYNTFIFSLKTMQVQHEFICHLLINVYVYLSF